MSTNRTPLAALAASALLWVAACADGGPQPRNLILFVPDGLRALQVSAETAPAMAALRDRGVNFANPHALFPTFTMPNAAAMGTGHQLGDTGVYGNTLYTAVPIAAANGTTTPFTEIDAVLGELNRHFDGNFISEEAILHAAYAHGFATAALGKHGPTLMFDSVARDGKQTIIFDDGPSIVRAATAATSTHGVVLVPEPDSTAYYWVNSFTDLFPFRSNVSVDQEGPLILGETLQPPYLWYGSRAASSSNQFQPKTTPVISCNGAWPCVYLPGGSGWWIDSLTFNVNRKNQSLIMLYDNGGEGSNFRNLSFNTGTTEDYSGIGFMVRPDAFHFNLDTINFLSGPSNAPNFIDTTWSPVLYFGPCSTCSNANNSVATWQMHNMSFYGRTAYELMAGGAAGPYEIDTNYTQGGLMPLMSFQNTVGTLGFSVKEDTFTNDTSGQPYLALWGGLLVDAKLENMYGLSAETGGTPPYTFVMDGVNFANLPVNNTFTALSGGAHAFTRTRSSRLGGKGYDRSHGAIGRLLVFVSWRLAEIAGQAAMVQS